MLNFYMLFSAVSHLFGQDSVMVNFNIESKDGKKTINR